MNREPTKGARVPRKAIRPRSGQAWPALLWRISVETSPEAEDAVTDLLIGILGQSVFSYSDVESGEVIVTAFLSSKGAWSQTVCDTIESGLQRIRNCDLRLGSGKVVLSKMPRRDWAEAWKRHFKPFRIGSGLMIRPGWSRLRPKPGQRIVVLDPGLSFGTGQHPTTRFCLRQLARHRAFYDRASLLDLGTGSGILAIAAAKLGYAPVMALDFDEDAITVARANARRNRLLGKILFRRQDVCRLPCHPKARYTVICANLLSPLLLSQRTRIVAQLRREGLLILAGILLEEFRTIRSRYAELGLICVATCKEREWCSGSFAWATDD